MNRTDPTISGSFVKVLWRRPGWMLLGVAAFFISTGLLPGVTTRCIAGAGSAQHEMGANMIRLISLSDIPMPVAVAQANGFFTKHGVMVHVEKVQNADQLRAAISDGSA